MNNLKHSEELYLYQQNEEKVCKPGDRNHRILLRCPVMCIEPSEHQDHVNPTAAHVVKNSTQILQGI